MSIHLPSTFTGLGEFVFSTGPSFAPELAGIEEEPACAGAKASGSVSILLRQVFGGVKRWESPDVRRGEFYDRSRDLIFL